MINWVNSETVEISLSVAAALVAFASKDDTRASCGVGVDRGALCATDGHRLVLFPVQSATVADGARPVAMTGCRWHRSHVEKLIKIARAEKADRIVLSREQTMGVQFAPCWRVVPDYGFEAKSEARIGLDPKYLADLVPVTKACDAKFVQLTQAKSDLDPVGFLVQGAEHEARVVVMPGRV